MKEYIAEDRLAIVQKIVNDELHTSTTARATPAKERNEMNLTPEEERELSRLQNRRDVTAKALPNTRGNTGGGAEAAYSDACRELFTFRREHGEVGLMLPKRKWRGW